eukprot:SM000206S06276  [mRNA]  locus=s206:120364:123062:+ [translate_table: standard]
MVKSHIKEVVKVNFVVARRSRLLCCQHILQHSAKTGQLVAMTAPKLRSDIRLRKPSASIVKSRRAAVSSRRSCPGGGGGDGHGGGGGGGGDGGARHARAQARASETGDGGKWRETGDTLPRPRSPPPARRSCVLPSGPGLRQGFSDSLRLRIKCRVSADLRLHQASSSPPCSLFPARRRAADDVLQQLFIVLRGC